ncbi:MAG: hypothetical protein WCG95_08205 [bacterium]
MKKINLTSDESGYKLLGISLAGSAVTLAGMILLHKRVLSKQINKSFTQKTPKILTNILYGGVSAAIAILLPIFILEKALTATKKLKPLSEAEQIEKEKQVRKTISDITKQKEVILDGIAFENFSQDNPKSTVLAAFDAKTGYLILHSKFKDTNLGIDELKSVVVHELAHAKQYENMARIKDGIYKINKAFVVGGVNSLSAKNKEELLNTIDFELSKDFNEETYCKINKIKDKK